jgi:UDP-2-acetamido-2-deoxy-ribo-hexuluronate aminotransferase
MGIAMVDLKGQYEKIKAEVDQAIQQVIDGTAFINGPAVKSFAADLESYLEVDHVIPCANGTDALQIAMMALEIERGSEVLVPSWTYVATVEVIALLGYLPVFVEVEPDSFNIDIDDLRKKISSKSKAIAPVHLYGQCANMDEILEIARQFGLKVIEDTAQALGAKHISKAGVIKRAGTIGDIGTTSFFPSKNLGCFGDGGAIMTNDKELASKMRMIANHGQKRKYYNELAGVNSRLDTIQAAILSVKLKHLDEYAAARNQVADRYDEAFAMLDTVETPFRSSFSDHVFHQYTLKLAKGINRDMLQSDLKELGIPSMIYYPIPNHLQPAYSSFGYKKGDLLVTEGLSKRVLSLPIHTEMGNETQSVIIDGFKECLVKYS